MPIPSDFSDSPLANSCGNGTYVFEISWNIMNVCLPFSTQGADQCRHGEWQLRIGCALRRFVVPRPWWQLHTGYEFAEPFFPHAEPLSPAGLFHNKSILAKSTEGDNAKVPVLNTKFMATYLVLINQNWSFKNIWPHFLSQWLKCPFQTISFDQIFLKLLIQACQGLRHM
jgi:hypothetical protein